MADVPINIHATLFCGQTFAWNKEGSSFYAVLGGRKIVLDEEHFIDDVLQDTMLFHYFDMGWEYSKAEQYLGTLDSHLADLIKQYQSIHILNQDPWEVLISFLLSQNNNIKRIRGMYHTLSTNYGTEVEPTSFAFPKPHELAGTGEAELRSLGMGFRAPYLLSAIDNADLLERIP
ncbi:MAG: DNA glycosylase, partial [Sphaerochaetaceae bacterium]